MILAAKTDIGRVRTENQDRFRIRELGDGVGAAVVCDGMGGTNGGGLAGEIAANAVYERICLSWREGMEPRAVKNLLVSAVTAANTLVYEKSRDCEENRGMGTTCVAAIIHNGTVSVASVGDSRAYILDGSGIRQITTDHTVVEYLKSRGMNDESKLAGMKNVITRAVGVEPQIEVDYFEFEAEKGSVLLICTDGLTNYCSDETLYRMVYKSPLESAAEELVKISNDGGGKDNITVVLAAI